MRTSEGGGAARTSVLVADDTSDLRQLVRFALERSGDFRVVAEAKNGQEAVALAGSLGPDMVLLDIAMPVMDGLEALPLIRQCCPDAILVIFSALDPGIVAQQAATAGAHGYLRKGEPLATMIALLRDLVASERS